MKKLLTFVLGAILTLHCIPLSQAATNGISTEFTAYNETQQVPASQSVIKAGDVVTFRMRATNTTSTPLQNYVMRVYVGDILPRMKIIDNGVGGLLRGDYLEYPSMTLGTCASCDNSNFFKVRFLEDCYEPKMRVTYEDKNIYLTLEQTNCPVRQTKTGPEATLLLLMALLSTTGVYLYRRRAARA